MPVLRKPIDAKREIQARQTIATSDQQRSAVQGCSVSNTNPELSWSGDGRPELKIARTCHSGENCLFSLTDLQKWSAHCAFHSCCSASWNGHPHRKRARRRVFCSCGSTQCGSRGSAQRRPTRCHGLCEHAQTAAQHVPGRVLVAVQLKAAHPPHRWTRSVSAFGTEQTPRKSDLA